MSSSIFVNANVFDKSLNLGAKILDTSEKKKREIFENNLPNILYSFSFIFNLDNNFEALVS